jgi:3'-phosphoadenosine 5'-phosphosulfate sulfotransferase (PAPS reductase)/FAD synthetase
MSVKHVLGISGGKDSAALAIYLKDRHPELDVEYYTCDTGRELDETYELIDKLESYLGKKIVLLQAVKPKEETPHSNTFDHFLDQYGGYLPSSNSRWCTKKLKLEPFEKYIGEEPTISYVGIRGDEDREGYISKKLNVQSIFPFRKNIWSEDVIKLVLHNKNINLFKQDYTQAASDEGVSVKSTYIDTPISESFTLKQKLHALLDFNTKIFNKAVFAYLKTTHYPVGRLEYFPLVENEDVLKINDIFKILDESGVGIPKYYLERTYQVEIDGEIKIGNYARSRSGCFFCFFQQKIEWVWLLENHPDLFRKAKEYEKDGYTWMDEETLSELEYPDRIAAIKKEHYLRIQRKNRNRTNSSWKDEIMGVEGEGCASCFI